VQGIISRSERCNYAGSRAIACSFTRDCAYKLRCNSLPGSKVISDFNPDEVRKYKNNSENSQKKNHLNYVNKRLLSV
jgi:hypothetical protein